MSTSDLSQAAAGTADPHTPTPEAGPVPAGEPSAGLGRATARGAGVTLAGQLLRILLQLASTTVLARLLSPRDYGLLAVGLVVVGVGEIFRDMGLSTAAVRAPHLTDAQRDGLFWLNTAAGALLGGAAFAAAPLVAAGFGQPALVGITRALAATFLLNGLAAQYRAGLSRDLRFGGLVVVDLLGPAVALGVAITVAASGAGYWALVAQQLTQAAVVLVLLGLLARWLPGRPRRGVGLMPHVRFGGGLTGTHVVYYLGNNLDSIALGLLAGPAALGLYNRGFQLLMTPLNQIRSPASTVAVPVLARLQDDAERFGEYLRRGQLALGYTLVAGMALVAGASRPVVHLLLGARWDAVAPVLTLLAVAGCAQTLAYVGSWVYLSRGLSAALLRYTLVTLVLSAVCIGAGSPFGVVGVAAGYATAALLEWPLSIWWLSRATVIPARALLVGAVRISACAVLAGGTCFAVTELTATWPAVGQIAAAGLAGLAVYAVASVVPAVRTDLLGVKEWGQRMVGR